MSVETETGYRAQIKIFVSKGENSQGPKFVCVCVLFQIPNTIFKSVSRLARDADGASKDAIQLQGNLLES